MPFVARLRGRSEFLLLAEPGLLENEKNVAFNATGLSGKFAYERFDPSSEREIELESQEITAAQRQGFTDYSANVDRAEEHRRTVEALNAFASQHPFRHGAERVGGAFLPKGHYEWADAIEKLDNWLRHATDEDVIGEIGNYAGKKWLETTLPELTAGVIAVGIHADTRAVGVASFLAFVDRCGGPARVRGRRTSGGPILLSDDETEQFAASYFYW